MRLRNRESEALRSLYSSGVHCHRYSDDSDRSYLSIFAKLISRGAFSGSPSGDPVFLEASSRELRVRNPASDKQS